MTKQGLWSTKTVLLYSLQTSEASIGWIPMRNNAIHTVSSRGMKFPPNIFFRIVNIIRLGKAIVSLD